MASSTSASQEKPNKRIVVFVHGGASSSRMFKDVTPILSAQGFVVTAPDLPGHGKAASRGPFTFPSAVETITKCLQNVRGSDGSSSAPRVMVVGISLGAQVVLSLLQSKPDLVDAAIVSGASIHPPDEKARWELPYTPSDKAWVNLMMEDVALLGFHNTPALQEKSFAFTFDPNQDPQKENFPPVLVMVGEKDIAMARRDYDELVAICKGANERSEGMVLQGAWHNHSIDVPDKFAAAVKEWANKVL